MMGVTTSVAPALTQSTALLDSDDADNEPPQPHLSAGGSPSQANFRQAPSQSSASDQSQGQFPDKRSDERLNKQNREDHSFGQKPDSTPDIPLALQTPASLSTSSPTSTSPTAPAAGSFSATLSSPLSASPLTPPRQFPTAEVEVHDTIPEESDETDYDTPNEPVTPVSGRQSREGFHPLEPVSESTPQPKADSNAVTVGLPIALSAHPGVQEHSGKPHSHHGHKHHNPRHPRHQRQSSNISANGDDCTTFSEQPPLTPKPTKHLPPPLSTAGLNTAQLVPAVALRPETPTTRPTTAVNGSFLISVPNGNVSGPGTATETSSITVVNSATNTETPPSPSQTRRSSRNSASTSSFKRTMSNLFRRSNSQNEKVAFGMPDYGTAASDSNLVEMATNVSNHRKTPSRRWSMHRSLATTQSNSPPSPGSPPLEMVVGTKSEAGAGAGPSTANGASVGSTNPAAKARNTQAAMPTQEDFFQNDDKKHRQRASTGLSIHNAIHIVTGSSGPLGSRRNKNKNKRVEYRRRASSFEHGSHNPPVEIRGEPWALPAEAGTGLKARRMSLSLPDDFTVDVVDLHEEFEYQHMLGRHRRHLGKGATSKVTLMYRKGFPDELYAVKEFRGKSSSETREEYEKKVKSEYSIAKSLHHPNIVETVRLCTDHGRWNHVMEYCQEGDLYSLVEKKYLTTTEREKDRQCLFKQLVQGLNYLHAHGIAHRDIKLENLLITNNSKLKITDFGASDIFSGIHPGLREAGGQCGRHMDDAVRLCKPGICGSLPYISPEVLEAKEPYDPRKLDVWAAAVVMLNLIFGAPLWAEARIKPGQSNPQYQSLVRGWEKWNSTHLTEKQEAEKQHAEKQAVQKDQAQNERNSEETAALEAAGTAVTDAASAPAATAVSATMNNETADAATAAHLNGIPAAGVAAEPDTRPKVTAVPVTDGNPNSIVEGPYPKVMALDAFVNPPVLRRILIQMLNPDPKRRVTIDQVANLRWLRNIECCQQECYEDPMAAPTTTANAHTIDASKPGATSHNGQKIFCHDHLPPKAHSHAIGRMG